MTQRYSSIWIRFRSDDVGTANGFEAFYELVHGVDLTGKCIDLRSSSIS